MTQFTIIIMVISYLFTFYFIFRFYKNYRRINATDTAKQLMETILRTRKTVKYYISFVLISSGISFVAGLYLIIHTHMNSVTAQPGQDMHFDTMQWLLFIGAIALILAIFLGLIWLIYRIIYGILLKRLHKNYKELRKLEM